VVAHAVQAENLRMLLRHRPWLALATTLVALASCDLNPQPVLPADRMASDPMINGGTIALEPGPDDSGKGGAGVSEPVGGEPVGGEPSGGAGSEATTAGAGGETTAGAGGETPGAAGADSGGENAAGAGGANP
jgi:hypothetical protein